MAFLMGEGLGTQAQGGICVHRDSTGPCGRAAPHPKLAGAGCRGRGRLLTRPLLPCRPRRPWPRWRWQTQSETASPPWALAARRSCGAAAGPVQQPRARRPQPPSSSGTSSGWAVAPAPSICGRPGGPRPRCGVPWLDACASHPCWPLRAPRHGLEGPLVPSVGYSQVQTQSPPLPSCAALGKSHSLSVPQFTHLSDGAFFRVSGGGGSTAQGGTGEGSAGASWASAGRGCRGGRRGPEAPPGRRGAREGTGSKAASPSGRGVWGELGRGPRGQAAPGPPVPSPSRGHSPQLVCPRQLGLAHRQPGAKWVPVAGLSSGVWG